MRQCEGEEDEFNLQMQQLNLFSLLRSFGLNKGLPGYKHLAPLGRSAKAFKVDLVTQLIKLAGQEGGLAPAFTLQSLNLILRVAYNHTGYCRSQFSRLDRLGKKHLVACFERAHPIFHSDVCR